MRFRLLFSILLLLEVFFITAQNRSNPFELTFRLTEEAVGSAEALAGAVNPFEVVQHRVPGLSSLSVGKRVVSLRPGSFLPRGGGLSRAELFWYMVLFFSYLAFSVSTGRKALSTAWRAFSSDGSFSLLHRDLTGMGGLGSFYALYINFFIQAGLFIFLCMRYFDPGGANNLGLLFFCILAVASIFGLKHLLIRYVHWLIAEKKGVQRYNLLIILFNSILGLFLVPFNILIEYGGDFQGIMIFWIFGLILVFYIYRIFRAVNIATKYLYSDLFHFLLYLCTAELAPVAVMAKIITDSI